MRGNSSSSVPNSSSSPTKLASNGSRESLQLGGEGTVVDSHPIAIGNCLVVKYRDGSNRLAKIIERSKKSEDQWQYYVHYHDFNRRMDEWVTLDRIVSLPSQANVLDRQHKQKLQQASSTTPPPAGRGAGNRDVSANGGGGYGGGIIGRSSNGGNGSSSVSLSTTLPPKNFNSQPVARMDNDIIKPPNTSSSNLHGDSLAIAVDGISATSGSDAKRRRPNSPNMVIKIAASNEESKPANDSGKEREKGDGDLEESDQNRVTTVAELDYDEHEGLDEAQLLEHEEITKVKNVNYVLFGENMMECWYYSPFPKEFNPDGPINCLYFCEFTFRFFRTKNELIRFQAKPDIPRHPPGNEIYRDSRVSMFELDGNVQRIYCQNLCYFAKLFLDHKTLYWDVDTFLFYVLCTQDERGYHPVGFFSKEKYSEMGYNLACILTFPSAQRRGYGRFLISFSYELSKKEEKIGSPEKPLSDLGAVSYKSYWASTLLQVLRNYPAGNISIMDLTRITSILCEDIVATLHMLGLLQTVGDETIIYAPMEVVTELMKKYPTTGIQVDSNLLHWTPLSITDPKYDRWSFAFDPSTLQH